jgi:hypothetical protein
MFTYLRLELFQQNMAREFGLRHFGKLCDNILICKCE